MKAAVTNSASAVTGPAAAVDAADGHPLVAAVASLAASTLRPALLETDQHGVPAGAIDALRDAGALNHMASAAFGGAGLQRPEERRVHEHIAAACLNTWLVWAQHGSLATRVEAALRGEPPRHELTDNLLRGRLLAGAALSDVRRYPHRFIAAERADGGWRFRGTVSWVSGWGLNRVLLTAAVEPATERVVLALVPVGDGLTPTPLHLAALGGSRTVRVVLRDVFVDNSLVLSVEPLEAWRAKDDQTAVDAKPHLFGLASAILAELRGERHPLARQAAELWQPRIAGLRSRSYALADADNAAEHFRERLDVRVEAGEALGALSRTLLVARAGRSLVRSDSAQFYLRSAHFLLVQAQTDTVRAAQLAALA